jgi:hypothetical protein
MSDEELDEKAAGAFARAIWVAPTPTGCRAARHIYTIQRSVSMYISTA